MLHFYDSANKIQGRNDEEIKELPCSTSLWTRMLHEMDQGEICFIICLIFTSCADIIYSVRRLDKSQMVWFVPQRCFSFSINTHV